MMTMKMLMTLTIMLRKMMTTMIIDDYDNVDIKGHFFSSLTKHETVNTPTNRPMDIYLFSTIYRLFVQIKNKTFLTRFIINMVGGLTYMATGIETNRPTDNDP